MKALAQSKLFWLGLLLRLGALPFFGSHYMRDLFIPFLDAAVTHPGSNPWTLLPPSYFPYGSFLFALLYVPRQLAFWLFGPGVLAASGVSLALCKLPLLAAEVCLLNAMAKRLNYTRSLLIYYWLNPVLFYITYIYGQLDAVMTACTVLSLFLLIDRRLVWSALAMSCAIASKFSAAVAVPLVLTYLWRREFPKIARQQAALWLGIFGTVTVIGFLPVLTAGQIGYTSVASPEALRIFAAKIDLGGGLMLDLGIALVLAVLGRLCLSTTLSATGLLYGTGLVFGLLVATTNAAPGWYYWPLPFMAMLYASHEPAPKAPWFLLHAAYFFNFVVIPAHILPFGLNHSEDASAAFSVLQTGMFALLVVMWVVALKGEAKLERLIKPLMIGIAGDSAAGKNRLSNTLMTLFGEKHCEMLEGDDYHRWERGDERYQRYTHLSPRANHLRVLDKHTKRLTAGRLVQQRHYDHGTGRFTALRQIKAHRTVVVQGLHTFYLRNMRQAFDLKVFLDPDPLVQLAWKLRRDVKERGHNRQKVLASMEARRQDALLHIAPQRAFADWIIQAVPRGDASKDSVLDGVMPEIMLRHVLWNDVDLDGFIHMLSQIDGVEWTLERDGGDLDRTALILAGHPSVEQIAWMASQLFSHLRPITRSPQPPQWLGGLDGLTQLLALTLLSGGSHAAHEESRFGSDQTPSEPGRGPSAVAAGMGGGGRPALPHHADDRLAPSA